MARYIRILRLPNFALRTVQRMKSGLTPDPSYHASMFYDLEARRKTEIEELNGLIVSLASKVSVPCPVNTTLARLVRDAEAAKRGSPRLSPEALLSEIQKEVPGFRDSEGQLGPWLVGGACMLLCATAIAKL
mmetsp:Transcript_16161/g.36721  ORF Transcript_16161/g.36721 Transcript_16161/m.36721 type:complete len:132 (+) Transcript_16161:80-475(+)